MSLQLPAFAPWQQRMYAQTTAALDSGRLGHGLLFCGPAQLGKRLLAERLAQRMLCTARDSAGEPCGHCRSCQLFENRYQRESPELRPDGRLAKLVAACEEGLDMTGTEWEADWNKNGKKCDCDACSAAREVLENKDILVKKSIWIFGGDGWAYDIGFGGLDHVLAQNQNVNVLVLDTEVYSNTGGQASKATPTGSVAKFAAAGKRTKKKDLGVMAMSYGYVYVAQVAMSANPVQLLKAMNEAEAYDGPSLIIAYSPCINHGINMSFSQAEIRKAVAAGYWPLYRYNPLLADEGKNPLTLDSKDPTESYQDFIRGEVRYTSLVNSFPAAAETLFQQAEKDAQERLTRLKKMVAGD